jgi:hypothetical protein
MEGAVEREQVAYYGKEPEQGDDDLNSQVHSPLLEPNSVDTPPKSSVTIPLDTNLNPTLQIPKSDNWELNALRGACRVAREQYNEAVQYASAFRDTHANMLRAGEDLPKDIAEFVLELESRASGALSRLNILESEFEKRGGHTLEEFGSTPVEVPVVKSTSFVGKGPLTYLFPGSIAARSRNRYILQYPPSVEAHSNNSTAMRRSRSPHIAS